jgi:hypothetical protein
MEVARSRTGIRIARIGEASIDASFVHLTTFPA